MAYEKQTWHTGDVITQEKLNHMEDGIANAGALVIHLIESETPPEWVTEADPGTLPGTYGEVYFDATPSDIDSALQNNRPIYVVDVKVVGVEGDPTTGALKSISSVATMVYANPQEGETWRFYYGFIDAMTPSNLFQVFPDLTQGVVCSNGEDDYFVYFTTGGPM